MQSIINLRDLPLLGTPAGACILHLLALWSWAALLNFSAWTLLVVNLREKQSNSEGRIQQTKCLLQTLGTRGETAPRLSQWTELGKVGIDTDIDIDVDGYIHSYIYLYIYLLKNGSRQIPLTAV